MREEMIAAYNKGWALIPLKRNSKAPNLPIGHPFLNRKPTREEYKGFDFGNYGIVTGEISDICVLDVDQSKGSEAAEFVNPVAIETPQVLTPHGRHLYFKYNPAVRTRVDLFGKDSGIDIRSTGGYVVGPGSKVNGEVYVWDEVYGSDMPLADPPEWMWKAADQTKEQKMEDWKVDQEIGAGKRNNTLISLAGTLVLRDLPGPVVLEMLRVVNIMMCKPPLSDAEVQSIAESAERYRQ